jgi:hypothetical protein
MASSLTLDRSDPGVDELVSSWKDGGKYRVEIEITQNKSSPNAATYDVTSVTDTSSEMPEASTEEAAPAAPKAKAKPELTY